MSRMQSKATKQNNAARAAERAAAIRAEQAGKEKRRRAIVITVAVLAVFAVILGIGIAVQAGRDTTGQVATPPSGVVDQFAVPVGGQAPVSVDIYEDFMCPFCGQFERAGGDVLQRYVDQGDVQVRYHVISFLDRSSTTDYSTRAMNAYGVVLDTAGRQAAKEFHDLLYAHQPEEGSAGLSDQQLIDLAVQAGASRSAVAAPIRSLRFEQWVENATDAASQDDVNSTPTVFVDGKRVEATTIDGLVADMQQAIESAAAQSR
jgi:protein-disulfide isomerase